MNDIINRADDTIGGIIALGLDILAMGTIAVSLNPAWNAIKTQSWSAFPVISVPILISSWFLFSSDNSSSNEITPLEMLSKLKYDVGYIGGEVTGTNYDDDDEWDDEE